MLGFFRNIFKSRLGVAITLAFLALIAVAFVSADVTGSMFGGVAGGDRVASVGKGRLDSGELKTRIRNIYEQQRQDPQNAQLTMKQFLSGETMDQIIEGLVSREAMYQFGIRNGMVISDRLIDSELVKMTQFKGVSGQFDRDLFLRTIQQKGYTEEIARHEIAQSLIGAQLSSAALYGTKMPPSMVRQYLAIFKERRIGAVGVIPSAAFAPKEPPADAVLNKFYADNKARYTRPERRTVRYLSLTDASLKDVPAPSEAEIAKRYNDNKAVYAAAELRSATQVIVLTEPAAKALAAEVAGGKTLAAAAAAKGLSPTRLDKVTKEALAAQTSPEVANAVFAAAQGKVAAPAKGPLGWVVVHVDGITQNPGKTLDQARAEITTELAADKRRRALADLASKIDEEIGSGRGLSDVAKELGLEVQSTPELTADGQVYGQAGQRAPDAVLPILSGAFGMDRQGKAQLVAAPGGTAFTVFDVGAITPATPAPLAEIKDLVVRDWQLDQGSIKAREAADKVLAQVAKGTSLDAALKSLGVPLPPAETIERSRQEIMQSQQGVPPPLALMFAMAKGTTKRLEAPNKAAWIIVSLKEIIPGEVKDDDPLLKEAEPQFGGIVGREYADQLAAAVRKDVGVERNEAAIKALRTDLVGSGQ